MTHENKQIKMLRNILLKYSTDIIYTGEHYVFTNKDSITNQLFKTMKNKLFQIRVLFLYTINLQ